MYSIKKGGSTFELSFCPWEKDFPAKPKTKATVGWNDGGFILHLESKENNLRMVEHEHNSMVCQDSCMEFFVQPSPKTDERYFNIEINPNGAVNMSIRYDRKRSQKIQNDDIALLSVKPTILNDGWAVDYLIPLELIKKHIPTYVHQKGAIIRANFFKCGDLTDHPHYLTFANINTPTPDFHRPECFAEFVLED